MHQSKALVELIRDMLILKMFVVLFGQKYPLNTIFLSDMIIIIINLFKSYDLISSLKTKLFVMIFCKENKNNK